MLCLQNILLKNLLDACVGAIAFYLVGYAFAYGDGNDNAFIGTSNFALRNIGLDDGRGWSLFVFNWAFSAAAATIVSGSVAERTVFNAYLAYSVLLTAFVYPVVVHWYALLSFVSASSLSQTACRSDYKKNPKVYH